MLFFDFVFLYHPLSKMTLFTPVPSVPGTASDTKSTVNICWMNDQKETMTTVARTLAEHGAKTFTWIFFFHYRQVLSLILFR